MRYARLRKAVDAGLEDASVLSAKQPKRKRLNLQGSNAVEPELPEDVAARLDKLRPLHGKNKTPRTPKPDEINSPPVKLNETSEPDLPSEILERLTRSRKAEE